MTSHWCQDSVQVAPNSLAKPNTSLVAPNSLNVFDIKSTSQLLSVASNSLSKPNPNNIAVKTTFTQQNMNSKIFIIIYEII